MRTNLKHNLTHQLTHSLGMAIVKGDYPIGTGLPSEADLCVEYDVSRSATREAVKMLSAKGLISSRPKQGIIVLPENNWNMFDTDVLGWILNSRPSLTLLKEFTQVRLAIEPEAAALAALNGNEEDFIEIENALGRMADADNGLDDPLEADIAFHTALLVASGNRFIAQLSDFIDTALRVSVRYNNRAKYIAGADVKKHAVILDMLRARQPEQARGSVKEILDEAVDQIDAQLAHKIVA